MPSNKKPVLSILIDGDKRDRFSWLCQRSGRPMAYAINKFIDRCLECGSIELPSDLVLEYSGGDQLVDGLLRMLPRFEHGLQRLGRERLKQEITPEDEAVEDSEGTYYEPEADPALAWMYESSEPTEDAESSNDEWDEPELSDIPDPEWMDEQPTASSILGSASANTNEEIESHNDKCNAKAKAEFLAGWAERYGGASLR